MRIRDCDNGPFLEIVDMSSHGDVVLGQFFTSPV